MKAYVLEDINKLVYKDVDMGMWPDKGWMPWMPPPGVPGGGDVYKISYKNNITSIVKVKGSLKESARSMWIWL